MKHSYRLLISLIILFGLPIFSIELIAQQNAKPRIIVTADPELDDNNSLIRFLLYSTDINIEGLIYASSQFHWKGDGKGTKFMVPGREYTRYGLNLCPCESYRWKKDERFIHDAVEAYEKVYPNLVKHDANYPKPAYLKSKIKYGNIEFEGDITKETEGSNYIKNVILDNVPGPLFITAWGGQSTIARALKSIEEKYRGTKDWDAIQKKVSNKVVLLPSGDQDGTYASYIMPNWPDIDYRQFRNGPNYGYGAQLVASAENKNYLTAEWMTNNIRSKGPLGELYRVWGDGKHMAEGDIFDYFGMDGYTDSALKAKGYIVWMPVQPKGSWLGEGDNPTFMNMLDNGLYAWEKDSPGGWGGRPFYPNLQTYIDPFSNDTSKVKDLVISASTLNRLDQNDSELEVFPDFFAAAQKDFAARMDWSVKTSFKSANHAPIISLNTNRVLYVKPGQEIKLNASVKEPDGDGYSIKWWQFSTYKNATKLDVSENTSLITTITVPRSVQPGQRYFIVLEVSDNKVASLTAYQTVKLIVQN